MLSIMTIMMMLENDATTIDPAGRYRRTIKMLNKLYAIAQEAPG